MAPVLVWDEVDEDDEEDVLPPVEEGEDPEEEEEDGAGGKLETAKTAEREGLDQLGVWLLTLVRCGLVSKKEMVGLTLRRNNAGPLGRLCMSEGWQCRKAQMSLHSCQRLPDLAQRDRGC